ncbi:MAG: PQQ-binding-like beta-propeller repeat protein [Bryobacteraceae bacterium]|nr:PQQ-binding-like beta-propeller repeat protein [Bryobacteraceae bacterium]MDW8379577.1 PQQ-binding-like beta-propeller repeat protein [Bryobacterales bacterium]
MSRMPAFLTILGSVALLAGAEWPQLRGPQGRGVSNSSTLPRQFGPNQKVIWKVNLPWGHSSPVISGDRIFLTGAEGGEKSGAGLNKVSDQGGRLFTICLDRKTGRVLWMQPAPRPRQERFQPTNSPASPSPVVDGDTVYVFFGDFGVLAYGFDGKERWRHPLGPFNNVNGHGSSPIIYGRMLLLVCDQDTNSFLIALDKRTGKLIYTIDRSEFTRSYVTPLVYQPPNGRAELIVPGAYTLIAYDVENGRKLWWIGGLSWQPKSMPIEYEGLIYAHWWESGGEAETVTETPRFREILQQVDANQDGRISKEETRRDERLHRIFDSIDLAMDGWLDERDWENHRARRASRNSLLAVRPGGRGDVGATHIVWRMQKFLPNCPTPLIYQGVMYLIKDGGILTTLNPKTGEIYKQGRLTGALDTYYSSPVAGAGLVYFCSQTGKVSIVKAGAQWEMVGQTDLEDEIYATPALVDNRIYLRTRHTLYCFGD